MTSYSSSEINTLLKGQLIGNTTNRIEGAEEIQKAGHTQITFIGSHKYLKFWEASKASVALVYPTLTSEPGNDRTFIKVKNVDLAMAQLLELFNPSTPVFEIDIHPTAVIHETAKIGEGCRIGANCYLGKDVELGSGVILYPNVCVFDETVIGNNTVSLVWDSYTRTLYYW